MCWRLTNYGQKYTLARFAGNGKSRNIWKKGRPRQSFLFGIMSLSQYWINIASAKLHARLNPRSFVSMFGMPPAVLPVIWTKISSSFKILKLKPLHLLWLLNWLHLYQTEDASAILWRVARETFTKYRDSALFALHDTLDEVHWSDRFKDFVPTEGLFRGCTFSVDVTECELSRPNDKDIERLFWSGKAGCPTFKYEVATQIASGRIVWFAGGVPAVSDVKILEMSGLLNKLLPHERGLADKGYVKSSISDKIIYPFKAPNTEPGHLLFNRAHSAVRILVERTNCLIKQFKILSVPFRHKVALHATVFSVICNLVNIRLTIFPLVKEPHKLLQGLPVTFKVNKRAPRATQ